jgi:UDP-glucose 4-epimerase
VSDANRPRALVTGGAGFVGSNLVDRLLAEGWRVLVIDDMSSGQVANVATAARVEMLDIAADDLGPIARSWRPHVVYHLAAQASVPLSMQDPLRDLAVNVIGTNRVATAARLAGTGRLVFVSSGGAIYGDVRQAATEDTRPAPTSYYGLHKLAAEGHITLSGVPYAIARPTNIYGPRQSGGLEGAVIATFLRRALTRQPLTIEGDGRQTRDFVHVSDVVAALVLLGDRAGRIGTWNVASGRSVSIEELASLVEGALGEQLGRIRAPVRAGDVRHSAASAARLRRLGWRPLVALAAGLRELIVASVSSAEGR